MWEFWANQLLPNPLKSCPKSNKSPNLVTLEISHLLETVDLDSRPSYPDVLICNDIA